MQSVLESIYNDMFQMMYNTAFGILRSREDAEDAVQEAMIRLMSRGAALTFIEPDKMGGYIYIVVRNIAVDMLRCRKNELNGIERLRSNTMPYKEDSIDTLISCHEAAEMIEQLPEGQRLAVRAKVYLGVTYSEGAGMLGITETAFRGRIYAARKKLRALS